jgi:hypothetical protein
MQPEADVTSLSSPTERTISAIPLGRLIDWPNAAPASLMVGLGDPVNGARVPDVFDEQQWMTYDGVEVISRLQEDTLAKLARQATNVTYFSARTRPFDLVTLYQQWVSGTNDKFVVKEFSTFATPKDIRIC